MSKDQKITNDIKVPNKDLEVLRANFPQCFDKEGNFQFENVYKNDLASCRAIQNDGKIILNTENYTNGVYFYTLFNNTTKLGVGKFTVAH